MQCGVCSLTRPKLITKAMFPMYPLDHVICRGGFWRENYSQSWIRGFFPPVSFCPYFLSINLPSPHSSFTLLMPIFHFFLSTDFFSNPITYPFSLTPCFSNLPLLLQPALLRQCLLFPPPLLTLPLYFPSNSVHQ